MVRPDLSFSEVLLQTEDKDTQIKTKIYNYHRFCIIRPIKKSLFEIVDTC